MQFYRFDNLKSFPVLDSFSKGCTNIQTTIKSWGSSVVGTVPEPISESQALAYPVLNPETGQHRSSLIPSLALLEIAAQGLTDANPIDVVLALPAMGISGHIEAVEILLGSCCKPCQISIEASKVRGEPFTIDLGSAAAEAMGSLWCTFDWKSALADSPGHVGKDIPSTFIHLHRIRFRWPAGITRAQLSLASLHVYGNIRRASSLIAESGTS